MVIIYDIKVFYQQIRRLSLYLYHFNNTNEIIVLNVF